MLKNFKFIYKIYLIVFNNVLYKNKKFKKVEIFLKAIK